MCRPLVAEGAVPTGTMRRGPRGRRRDRLSNPPRRNRPDPARFATTTGLSRLPAPLRDRPLASGEPHRWRGHRALEPGRRLGGESCGQSTGAGCRLPRSTTTTSCRGSFAFLTPRGRWLREPSPGFSHAVGGAGACLHRRLATVRPRRGAPGGERSEFGPVRSLTGCPSRLAPARWF